MIRINLMKKMYHLVWKGITDLLSSIIRLVAIDYIMISEFKYLNLTIYNQIIICYFFVFFINREASMVGDL